ncbi:MAG: hypothetical protein ACM3PU_12820 [Gemmatimonadota bacterium]
MRAVQRKRRGSRKVPIATNETILVVVGGISGMTAALDGQLIRAIRLEEIAARPVKK